MAVRKSARQPRQTKLPAGFVDVEQALEEFDELPPKVDDSDDSASDVNDSGTGHRKKRVRRSIKEPSPTPSLRLTPIPLSPLPGFSSPGGMSSASESVNNKTIDQINFTIHVPPNRTEPYVVQLKLQDLLQASSGSNMVVHPQAVIRQPSPDFDMSPRRMSFLDLPPEIRNKCYRFMFTSKGNIHFGRPDNMARSSAFLATCSAINTEGSEILYGENAFCLTRENRARGQYYQPKWTEVGFKDCLRFLNSIGPLNISRLRRLDFELYDASPGNTPGISHEDRRFVNDPVLIQIFRLLEKHGSLREVGLHLRGRREVRFADHHFLKHLCRIQADKINWLHHNVIVRSKLEVNLRQKLEDMIERKKPLYMVIPPKRKCKCTQVKCKCVRKR